MASGRKNNSIIDAVTKFIKDTLLAYDNQEVTTAEFLISVKGLTPLIIIFCLRN